MSELEWLTPEQVADISQHHVQTVYEDLRAGRLRGTQPKRRGHWRVHRDNVTAWMNGQLPQRHLASVGGSR